MDLRVWAVIEHEACGLFMNEDDASIHSLYLTEDGARRAADKLTNERGQKNEWWLSYSYAPEPVENDLPEPPVATEDPACQCWNEGQWGRVHREDCPIHKDGA